MSIFSTCCFTASPTLFATKIPELPSFSFGSTFSAFFILSASLALATPTSWGWGGCTLCIFGFSCSWSRAWLEAGGDLIFCKGAVASGGARPAAIPTQYQNGCAHNTPFALASASSFAISLRVCVHVCVYVCMCVYRTTVKGILSMLCDMSHMVSHSRLHALPYGWQLIVQLSSLYLLNLTFQRAVWNRGKVPLSRHQLSLHVYVL